LTFDITHGDSSFNALANNDSKISTVGIPLFFLKYTLPIQVKKEALFLDHVGFLSLWLNLALIVSVRQPTYELPSERMQYDESSAKYFLHPAANVQGLAHIHPSFDTHALHITTESSVDVNPSRRRSDGAIMPRVGTPSTISAIATEGRHFYLAVFDYTFTTILVCLRILQCLT
jgi:hypothetical protein